MGGPKSPSWERCTRKKTLDEGHATLRPLKHGLLYDTYGADTLDTDTSTELPPAPESIDSRGVHSSSYIRFITASDRCQTMKRGTSGQNETNSGFHDDERYSRSYQLIR